MNKRRRTMTQAEQIQPSQWSSTTRNIRVDRSSTSSLATLLLDSTFSDVELVVEEEVFPAHKIILSARSSYFR
jgi:hypothetical protein